MTVTKRIIIILFLFFNSESFSVFHTKQSYEKEGFSERTVFRLDLEKFPLKVCLDGNLPPGWPAVINEAADMWEVAVQDFYNKYLNSYAEREVRKQFESLFNLFNVYSNCKSKGIEPDVYVSRNRLNSADYTHSLFYVGKKTAEEKTVGRTNYEVIPTWFGLSYELYYLVIDFDKETYFGVETVSRHGRERFLINTAMHELGHVLDMVHSKEQDLMYWDDTYCLGKICRPTERNVYDFLSSYLGPGMKFDLHFYIADVQIKKKIKGETPDAWAVELLAPR